MSQLPPKNDMKVMFLEVQNFMGIKHQVIHLDGRSAWLIGANAAGKSSLISALLSFGDSKYIPQKPINEGEERGRISMRVAGHRKGEYEEYTADVVFTPSNGKGTLVLKDKDGATVKSPKTILKDILGKGFSIYDFLRADKKKQVAEIKRIADIEEPLNAIERDKAALEDDRRILRKEIDEYLAVNKRENRPFSDQDIDDYKEPVDEEEIAVRLKDIEPKQEKWQKQADGVKDTERLIESNMQVAARIDVEVMDLEKQIEELRKKIDQKKESAVAFRKSNEELQEKVDKAKLWLAKNVKPSTEALIQEQADARAHNEKHRLINTYMVRQREIMKKQDEWEEKQDEIKALDKKRDDIIMSSKLPVEGLTITADDIFLNGLPLDDAQINTATLLDLSIDISAALNNPLRLVAIKEASLFDRPHLQRTLKKLRDKGIQYIVEYVDPDGGPLEIKFEEEELA